MSDPRPPRQRLRSMPLFVRIFMLLLGTLVAMQAINAVLVVVTPPPAPRFFSLDQIERVLRGGDSDTMRRAVQAAPDLEPGVTPRERRIEELLRVRLGAGAGDIRVNLRRSGAQWRSLAGRRNLRDRPAIDGIVGNFTVALRRAERDWVVVSPAGLDLAFWRWRAIATLFLALLIAAPIAWWLSRRIARPIAMFGAAADRLGSDPRGDPIELSGPPEVAEAAAAFNRMQQRLQRYIADRALMLGAVAHDLRTPLMRIALHVDHAPEPVRAAVEGEVADMQAMLAAVLAFLRDQEQPSHRQRLDLRAMVQSVADELVDEGHRVELADGDPLVIDGNPQALKTLVTNLARNAANHAGGRVAIALGADASIVWLEVRDRGPGIAADMLERMFEPFVRGEESRSRATGGIGLGLASARAVARGHGGDVTLANRPGGGLVARAELSR